eukprot:UN14872
MMGVSSPRNSGVGEATMLVYMSSFSPTKQSIAFALND